jgi:hypothetical protein
VCPVITSQAHGAYVVCVTLLASHPCQALAICCRHIIASSVNINVVGSAAPAVNTFDLSVSVPAAIIVLNAPQNLSPESVLSPETNKILVQLTILINIAEKKLHRLGN